MAIVIHKLDASPPARAVLMIAEILKLKHETKEVNLLTGENMKPEYVERNPMHTVPLLEDGDFILADSHAILTYLVSKYGADKRGELYPADLAIRATVDQRLFFDATILFPACKASARPIIFGNEVAPAAKQIEDINEAYGILEKYLEKNRFVACDYLTLADVSCVSSVSSLNLLVPIDAKYEKVTAWFDRLKEEEWYQKANAPGLALLQGYIAAAIEKNKTKQL